MLNLNCLNSASGFFCSSYSTHSGLSMSLKGEILPLNRLGFDPPIPSFSPSVTAPSTEPLAKRIGAATLVLRKERRLSQEQLAGIMSTARSYVSKLERGLLILSFPTLKRTTSALGIDIAERFLRLRHPVPKS
jgi:hypothetical protein